MNGLRALNNFGITRCKVLIGNSTRHFSIEPFQHFRRNGRSTSNRIKISYNQDQKSYRHMTTYIVCSFIGAALSSDGFSSADDSALDELPIDNSKPVFRRSEIRKHTSREEGIWVTHGKGVYDITKFVVNHPGGQEKIILAAGGAVEPFWKIYQQHYNSNLAPNALKPLLIGYLHPEDVAIESAEQAISSDDPYSSDPPVSPVQIFHQRKPINSETPSTLLSDTWVTPKEMWFKRNHHPVPHLTAENYKLTISGPGVKDEKIEFDLNDLKTKFKKHKVSF
jgi:cytochrome b involved in lipid metabolism